MTKNIKIFWWKKELTLVWRTTFLGCLTGILFLLMKENSYKNSWMMMNWHVILKIFKVQIGILCASSLHQVKRAKLVGELSLDLLIYNWQILKTLAWLFWWDCSQMFATTLMLILYYLYLFLMSTWKELIDATLFWTKSFGLTKIAYQKPSFGNLNFKILITWNQVKKITLNLSSKSLQFKKFLRVKKNHHSMEFTLY